MGKELEITVAANAGFCMGVRRALNFCLEAANNPTSPKPICTLGPLIHNRQVLDVLEQKGVKVIHGEHMDGEAGTVVVRAHGISPEKRVYIGSISKKTIDATCPHVSRVQKIVAKYSALGYKCIIVGDPGHAEVDGVQSYCDGHGVVVSSAEDAEKLPEMEKAAIVAQTTQSESLFCRVVDIIKQKSENCEVFDTICRATQDRQNEALKLANEVEAMVVVGGYNSANTCRLAQICSDTGTPVFHVETDIELPIEEVLQYREIGITAGASTPNWMIKRVVNKLYRCEEERSHRFKLLLKKLLPIPNRTNLFLGGGAAGITYSAFMLLGLDTAFLSLCMALAFCFISSQHILHQYTKRKAMLLNEPERGEFFNKYAGFLISIAVIASACALILSFIVGIIPFTLIFAGTLGGIVYSLPNTGVIDVQRLKKAGGMTGSKEFFVALAWAVTTVFIPYIAGGGKNVYGLILFAFWVVLLAFQRTLFTDMRDIEGDQLVGRETLTVAYGSMFSIKLLLLLPPLQTIVLVILAYMGWILSAGYGMLVIPLYSLLILVLYYKEKLPPGESGEVLMDAVFYLTGAVSFLSQLN